MLASLYHIFIEARYAIVEGCTFENIQAEHAVVKIEEDHTKVLNCTYTGCTGTECTVDWCGCSDAWGALGDGVEYDGHPFKCEEGWAGKSGDAYAAHVAYAEAYGWTHDAEQ